MFAVAAARQHNRAAGKSCRSNRNREPDVSPTQPVRVGIVGAGAVGSRVARQLAGTPGVSVLLAAQDRGTAHQVASGIGSAVRVVEDIHDEDDLDAVVLATPVPHVALAERFLMQGTSVVSISDDRDDVWRLWGLDDLAIERNVSLVIGAGFAPGLSCLLARHAARTLTHVDEIHIAKHGTGGPACARQHHRALRSTASIWRDGDWRSRAGGSGRELCWFPDPIGAHDCYNAELPDPFLLLRAFPEVARISARVSATRRDRLTSRLPMLRKPHVEGALGAVRVEVRGLRDGQRFAEVVGAIDRPAVAAAAVTAVAVLRLAVPKEQVGAIVLSSERIDTQGFLVDLAARGIRAARFTGRL